jgi:hypothetical protein
MAGWEPVLGRWGGDTNGNIYLWATLREGPNGNQSS